MPWLFPSVFIASMEPGKVWWQETCHCSKEASGRGRAQDPAEQQEGLIKLRSRQGGEWVESSPAERCWLTQQSQCILGCIQNSVASRAQKVTFPLFSTLVRTHLDCCIQLQDPQCKKEVHLLEWLQGRLMKMIRGCSTSLTRTDRETAWRREGSGETL